MKRILKRVSIVLFALFLTAGVVMSDYETVYATGIEETLYYTYWDLITTLYSVCGYDANVQDEVIKNHGVTGKQVWHNFVTFVENFAKAHGKFFGDGLAQLKELANDLSDDGTFTISQSLYDLLRDCFADTATVSDVTNYKNQFDCSSPESVYNLILSITGCDGYENLSSLKSSSVLISVCSGKTLNIVHAIDNKGYYVFAYSGLFDYNSIDHSLHTFDGSGNEVQLSATNLYICYDNSKIYPSYSSISFGENYEWVIKNGSFCIDFPVDIVDVAADACPQEVPDTIEIVENPAIPDGWRIVEPDEDPQNDDDVIPALLPIVPPIPDKPTDTEKDSEKDTENEPGTSPKPNPNPDSDLNPKPDPNPDPDPEIDSDPVQSVTSSAGDITTLFPFCIPFDIARLVKGLKAKKSPPVFHFEYKFKQINYTFVIDVDLSDYEKYIKIFRYGMQIFYIIALMFLTIKVSKLFI